MQQLFEVTAAIYVRINEMNVFFDLVVPYCLLYSTGYDVIVAVVGYVE